MLADSGYLLIFWRAEAEESFKERTELSDDVLFFSPCPVVECSLNEDANFLGTKPVVSLACTVVRRAAPVVESVEPSPAGGCLELKMNG